MKIKIYAKLSQAIFQQGLTRPYRIWCFARTMGSSGWLYLDDLHDGWFQSKKTTSSVLKEGLDVFFHFDKGKKGKRKRLWLHAPARVGIAVGSELGNTATIDLPTAVSLKKFRAACYAALYIKKSVTISRARLKEMYVVTTPTLRSWEKAIGVEVTPNIAAQKIESMDDALALPVRLGPDNRSAWYWKGTVYWQMANTFHLSESSVLTSAPKARIANTRIRQALQAKLMREQEAPVRRVFYSDASRAARALSKGKTDCAYVQTSQVLGGARVWGHLWSPTSARWV